jgi:hypothetical protein
MLDVKKKKLNQKSLLHARVQGFSMGPAVLPPNNSLTLHVPGRNCAGILNLIPLKEFHSILSLIV